MRFSILAVWSYPVNYRIDHRIHVLHNTLSSNINVMDQSCGLEYQTGNQSGNMYYNCMDYYDPASPFWGNAMVIWLCPFTCIKHAVLTLNPLTAGAQYIRVFIFYWVPWIKHVRNKMWHQSARFENSLPPFCIIWIIFTPLKLWIASARHSFKWVKI